MTAHRRDSRTRSGSQCKSAAWMDCVMRAVQAKHGSRDSAVRSRSSPIACRSTIRAACPGSVSADVSRPPSFARCRRHRQVSGRVLPTGMATPALAVVASASAVLVGADARDELGTTPRWRRTAPRHLVARDRLPPVVPCQSAASQSQIARNVRGSGSLTASRLTRPLSFCASAAGCYGRTKMLEDRVVGGDDILFGNRASGSGSAGALNLRIGRGRDGVAGPLQAPAEPWSASMMRWICSHSTRPAVGCM
jgi:hypothetical protein